MHESIKMLSKVVFFFPCILMTVIIMVVIRMVLMLMVVMIMEMMMKMVMMEMAMLQSVLHPHAPVWPLPIHQSAPRGSSLPPACLPQHLTYYTKNNYKPLQPFRAS